ncbi:gluconolactonase [Vibrio nigripulchritudo ATCC 27043]|uniref:SMP-30/gluconolactonase/LRE family protein n=1 Tax=Vibrio nigripulchritudo TaxID=28173 RepID=UPI00021C2245|nr:SMP-30/gluconolactonase/LRE family protein [Vibrio nigripulchritudo]EGU61654.1 gluconolactonase [Vibrio nigripulchritudo ATCC 27043]
MLNFQKTIGDRCDLAEGCCWCDKTESFFWIDVTRSLLFQYKLYEEELVTFPTPAPPVNTLPSEDPDKLLVTLYDGLYLLDLKQREWVLWTEIDSDPLNRMNDGGVDRNGNIWLGSMQKNIADDGSPLDIGANGNFFSMVNRHTIRNHQTHIGVFNMMVFSPDDKWLYFADSMKSEIYRSPFHAQTSSIGSPEVFSKLGDSYGVPDGAAMDSEGHIWSARWDGAGIARLTHSGELETLYKVNTSRPTNVCFGGRDMKTLLVTTAAYMLEGDERAGEIQLYHSDVAGLPTYRANIPNWSRLQRV